MDKKDFGLRLYKLREKKGVSAQDMSLSIGQNRGYINNIEVGRTSPSLAGFFYICDYLGVTPMEFFDLDNENPIKTDSIFKELKQLNDRQLDAISVIIRDLVKK